MREHLEKDLHKVEKELKGVEAKLGKRQFVERAPQEIVNKERNRAAVLQERRTVLQKHLTTLEGGS